VPLAHLCILLTLLFPEVKPAQDGTLVILVGTDEDYLLYFFNVFGKVLLYPVGGPGSKFSQIGY
jgi:hypothetical protein